MSTSDLFLFLMLFCSACAEPEQKTLGIMDIRCVGLPAVPEWVMNKVQDELREGCSFHLKRIQPPVQSNHLVRGVRRGPNRMQRAGEHHQVDLVFDGSVERIADRLLIGWRIVIIADPTDEYFWVRDYPYDPDRLEEMMRSSLRQFLDQLRTSESWTCRTLHTEEN